VGVRLPPPAPWFQGVRAIPEGFQFVSHLNVLQLSSSGLPLTRRMMPILSFPYLSLDHRPPCLRLNIVQTTHRRLDTGVTQELFHNSDIDSMHQPLGGSKVTKTVKPHPIQFCYPSRFFKLLARSLPRLSGRRVDESLKDVDKPHESVQPL